MNLYFSFDWNSMDWLQYAPLLMQARYHVDQDKLRKSPASATGWYKGKHLLVPIKIVQNKDRAITSFDAIGKVTDLFLHNFNSEECRQKLRGRLKEVSVSSQHDLRVTIEVLKPYKP